MSHPDEVRVVEEWLRFNNDIATRAQAFVERKLYMCRNQTELALELATEFRQVAISSIVSVRLEEAKLWHANNVCDSQWANKRITELEKATK